MKIALVQDWLTSIGGAEKCVEAGCELWPDAHIYTLIYRPEVFTDSVISKHRIHTSRIQRLPLSKKKYRHYFMLYPAAVEQFDLRKYEVVVSFSAAFSHGVLTSPDQYHVCYKHTPMRYAWSGYHDYLQDPHLRGRCKKTVARFLLHRLRMWDYLAAQRPDVILANSQEVRRRIQKYYAREAEVLHPPVAVNDVQLRCPQDREDYFVTIGRLVPYKRVDLLVRTFASMPDKPLIVAGSGPEIARLRQLAAGAPNIHIQGFVDEQQKQRLLRQARAFVFAAHEDFGIAPVEAQAYGTPVVAFGRGGARETVVDSETGVLFEEQSESSLRNGIDRFLEIEDRLDVGAIRANAERFDESVFKKRLKQIVDKMQGK